MLFSVSVFSFFVSAALAAPIPFTPSSSQQIRRSSNSGGGWPYSSSSSSRDAFGISGNFKSSDLSTQDGHPVLIGNYPEGSYAGSDNPGIAGFIFEATGGGDTDNAKEAVLSYEVKFESGFEWALGGKLPGLYGGDNLDVAKTCAGGHHDDSCWSARLMWRDEGKGELYAYLPSTNQDLPICKDKCDVKYGASIGRGNYTFNAGEWTKLSERVRLNDVGKRNGEIEVYVNGDSKILVQGLELRKGDSGRIRGVMVHTFFGGSSSTDYKSPKDQTAAFRNFQVNVTDKL